MNSATFRRRLVGFTLIEMLVVLMIMGLLIGLVSVNLQPGARDMLRVEAGRLAQVLDLAIEESSISGKSLAWSSDETGYRFWRRGRDAEWSEILDSDLLRARSLPAGMTVAATLIEGMKSRKLARIEISPGRVMQAFEIDLSFGPEHVAVVASPVGELRLVSRTGEINAALVPK